MLRFNVSNVNNLNLLTIIIQNFVTNSKFYMSKIIRIFVVETSTKKRIIKFENIKVYNNKIVK